MSSQLSLWPCFAQECFLISIAASSWISSITVSFFPVAHVAPALQHFIISELKLCLLAVSCSFHLHPFETVLQHSHSIFQLQCCQCHFTFAHFSKLFNKSVVGFIFPSNAKPHWEGFDFWICCLAIKAALFPIPLLGFCSEEIQMPNSLIV